MKLKQIVRKDLLYVVSFFIVVGFICFSVLIPSLNNTFFLLLGLLAWFSYIGLFFKKKTIGIWIIIVRSHIPILYICLITAVLHDSILSGILYYVRMMSFYLIRPI